SAARMAMMAMTTRSSISVKAVPMDTNLVFGTTQLPGECSALVDMRRICAYAFTASRLFRNAKEQRRNHDPITLSILVVLVPPISKLPFNCSRTMSSPPFARRSSFPNLKGTKERVGVFKAQQESDFAQFHGGLCQIMTGKFAARIFHELLEGDACIS